MIKIVERALGLWGLEGAEWRLVAARENAVYEVRHATGHCALRLHRQGYRSDEELRSELAMMETCASGGLSVPAPQRAVNGDMLAIVESVQVDVLSWLQGDTLRSSIETCTEAEKTSLIRRLGREMALLHQICDAWSPPADFVRAHWDHNGLLGKAPLWDRFWENPHLSTNDKALFDRFRTAASKQLKSLEGSVDYGLIHADLVPENVLVDGTDLHFIDFDDGGFGYRLFDIATALLKHRDASNFVELRAALIEGYQSVRPGEIAHLDLFLALRAATYVGWNITRLSEDGGEQRNARFIATLRDLAEEFLAKTTP